MTYEHAKAKLIELIKTNPEKVKGLYFKPKMRKKDVILSLGLPPYKKLEHILRNYLGPSNYAGSRGGIERKHSRANKGVIDELVKLNDFQKDYFDLSLSIEEVFDKWSLMYSVKIAGRVTKALGNRVKRNLLSIAFSKGKHAMSVSKRLSSELAGRRFNISFSKGQFSITLNPDGDFAIGSYRNSRSLSSRTLANFISEKTGIEKGKIIFNEKLEQVNIISRKELKRKEASKEEPYLTVGSKAIRGNKSFYIAMGVEDFSEVEYWLRFSENNDQVRVERTGKTPESFCLTSYGLIGDRDLISYLKAKFSKQNSFRVYLEGDATGMTSTRIARASGRVMPRKKFKG